jgi:hypothetical protein
MLAGEKEVEGRRRDDDLWGTISSTSLSLAGEPSVERTSVGVELGRVEVADNILDGLDIAIPAIMSEHALRL